MNNIRVEHSAVKFDKALLDLHSVSAIGSSFMSLCCECLHRLYCTKVQHPPAQPHILKLRTVHSHLSLPSLTWVGVTAT